MNSRQVYREEVRLLLHRDNNPERKVAAVRLYLDESGGTELPHVVVAGMLINHSDFLQFEEVWDEILDAHGIVPPLHMKEFGPHGKLGKISACRRRELFLEISDLIKSHSICTVAATLSNSEYEGIIQPEVRDIYSVYAMCYNLALMMNHAIATNRYDGRIPVIFDIGNPYSSHLNKAHAAALRMQKAGTFLHLGDLYFDDDAEFGCLQASDVIAWCVRRRLSGTPFPPGMEPLNDVFLGGHNEADWKAELLDKLRNGIAAHLIEAQEEK